MWPSDETTEAKLRHPTYKHTHPGHSASKSTTIQEEAHTASAVSAIHQVLQIFGNSNFASQPLSVQVLALPVSYIKSITHTSIKQKNTPILFHRVLRDSTTNKLFRHNVGRLQNRFLPQGMKLDSRPGMCYNCVQVRQHLQVYKTAKGHISQNMVNTKPS